MEYHEIIKMYADQLAKQEAAITDVMRLEAAQLLELGALYVERRGHAKGAYEIGGAVCAMGALSCAETGDPWAAWRNRKGILTVDALVLAGHSLSAQAGDTVPIWNDAPERTAAEVTAAMRAAAVNLRMMVKTTAPVVVIVEEEEVMA